MPIAGALSWLEAVLPSSRMSRSGGAAKVEAVPVTLWKLIQDGGWAMVPLAFLSVMTVMLVLVFLFCLRRGAIVTTHYMNAADVVL